MPGFDLRPLLIVPAAALLASGAAYRLGGRTGRQYAVPVLGAVLMFGLDYAYELPLYAYLTAILVAPFLYHRSVKSRLASAAARCGAIELPELGVRLVLRADPAAGRIGLWVAEPLAGAVQDRPIVARPKELDEREAIHGPGTLSLALDFAGEMDDEYELTLHAPAPAAGSAELVAFHEDAFGAFTGLLADAAMAEGLPGMERWLVVRARPQEYAFRLLDVRALALLHDVFRLRTEGRQIYAHMSGGAARIGASRTFTAAELREFLAAGARWIQKVRETA